MNGDTVKRIPTSPVGEWIKLIASALVIPLTIMVFGWGVTIERRVTTIEANRFTSQDALEIYRELSKKADKENVPPREVRESLIRIEGNLNRHTEGHPQ